MNFLPWTVLPSHSLMIVPSNNNEKANINQDFPIGMKESLKEVQVVRGGSRRLKSSLWSLEISLRMRSKSGIDERLRNQLIEEEVGPESKKVYTVLNQLITYLIKELD